MDTITPDSFYQSQAARVEHERIFGKKTFRELALLDLGKAKTITMSNKPTKRKKSKKSNKEICPHCATKNFKRISIWESKCMKCGFERP